jgi:hypothetical protein
VGKVLRREDVHVEAGVTVPALDEERRRARPSVAARANGNL